jgi:SAM-dependent methyltransferase
MKLDYSLDYYSRLKEGAATSAKAVVPVVMDLIHPRSMIDLGCGTGTWLAEFKRQGVTDVLGVDGPHIPFSQLEIGPNEFVAADLLQPLRLRSYFDLAISLEVAEHLGEEQADEFVDTLTRFAPVVLFSAAIPHQGGEHHVNEQWPTYWADRFEQRKYIALDPFRSRFWKRADVDWWYAQNLVLYVRFDQIAKYPWIGETYDRGIPNFVHPENYLRQAWQSRVLRVAVDIATMTGPGDTIILADEDRFGDMYLPGRVVRPIVERNGMYYGPPSDDEDAIAQLTRMRREGADYLAIGWPAYWWLKHYKRFAAHLNENCQTVLINDDVVIFRIKAMAP